MDYNINFIVDAWLDLREEYVGGAISARIPVGTNYDSEIE